MCEGACSAVCRCLPPGSDIGGSPLKRYASLTPRAVLVRVGSLRLVREAARWSGHPRGQPARRPVRSTRVEHVAEKSRRRRRVPGAPPPRGPSSAPGSRPPTDSGGSATPGASGAGGISNGNGDPPMMATSTAISAVNSTALPKSPRWSCNGCRGVTRSPCAGAGSRRCALASPRSTTSRSVRALDAPRPCNATKRRRSWTAGRATSRRRRVGSGGW